MKTEHPERTNQYRLLPHSLRGSLIPTAIRMSGLPLKYLNDYQPFKYLLQFTAKISCKIADDQQKCEVFLKGGGRFRFNLSDPYWSKLLCRNYQYETEIQKLLELVSANDFCFLDCGANYGYWSILASSNSETCVETIAVEAVPPTYELLLENQKINDCSFKTANLALYDRDGETVQIWFHPNRHAGASIAGTGRKSDWSSYDVKTVTLDTLAKSFDNQDAPIVIKLDVEGLELKTIQGINELYRRPFIIIYEEHRKDRTNATTRAQLENEKLQVYFMSDSGRVIRINSAEEAGNVQKDKRRGYNFLLTAAGSEMDALLQANIL